MREVFVFQNKGEEEALSVDDPDRAESLSFPSPLLLVLEPYKRATLVDWQIWGRRWRRRRCGGSLRGTAGSRMIQWAQREPLKKDIYYVINIEVLNGKNSKDKSQLSEIQAMQVFC